MYARRARRSPPSPRLPRERLPRQAVPSRMRCLPRIPRLDLRLRQPHVAALLAVLDGLRGCHGSPVALDAIVAPAAKADLRWPADESGIAFSLYPRCRWISALRCPVAALRPLVVAPLLTVTVVAQSLRSRAACSSRLGRPCYQPPRKLQVSPSALRKSLPSTAHSR